MVTSHVVEEHNGKGRGHTDHGNGKGKGHDKHQDDAMADGVYEIEIGGINHDNPGPVSTTSPPTTLRDGSTLTTEAREGSVTIGEAGGQTALNLQTDSENGRTRLNIGFDEDQQVTLGELDDLSFDYFIDSHTSLAGDIHIPVIRLVIDADGDLSTTADRGELAFEWAYQDGADKAASPTTEDAWHNADLVGDDWVAWQRSNNTNWDQIANMTEFSDWADADGHSVAGGLHFDENSVILGFQIALGSGNGTGSMFVDNVQVGGVTYDFV